MTAPAQELERGEPVILKGDRFAADQAGARLERAHGLRDQREARQELCGTIATASELCILGFEPRK